MITTNSAFVLPSINGIGDWLVAQHEILQVSYRKLWLVTLVYVPDSVSSMEILVEDHSATCAIKNSNNQLQSLI